MDNVGLAEAHLSGNPVLPIFIFDKNILDELDLEDARVSFIHEQLSSMHEKLAEVQSGLTILHGDILEQLEELRNHVCLIISLSLL